MHGSGDSQEAPRAGRPHSVFFDVDDTLITWDRRLRPHAREVVIEAQRMGFDIYVWSGVGVRWEVVDVHGLRPYIRNCYQKPLSRHHERLKELAIPLVPDHVVDDDDEIVRVFGGTLIPAPLEPLHNDRELLRVLDDLQHRFGTGGTA